MSSRSKSKEEREAVFQPEFREDLRYWVETNRRTALKILKLIEALMRNPFQGIGKPEPLKFLGSGAWSRRITQEHRLVYVVGHSRIDFVQCRYHYLPVVNIPPPTCQFTRPVFRYSLHRHVISALSAMVVIAPATRLIRESVERMICLK